MRAFLALDIPEGIKERLAEVQSRLEDRCIKPVPIENMHLTLNFLGEVSSREAEEFVERLRNMELKKTDVAIRGLGVFPSEKYIRVIWAGAYGAEMLAKETCFMGECIEKGHVTIARVKCKVYVKDVLEEYKNVLFGSFTAERLVLYRSILRKPHPYYEEIDAINLL